MKRKGGKENVKVEKQKINQNSKEFVSMINDIKIENISIFIVDTAALRW